MINLIGENIEQPDFLVGITELSNNVEKTEGGIQVKPANYELGGLLNKGKKTNSLNFQSLLLRQPLPALPQEENFVSN